MPMSMMYLEIGDCLFEPVKDKRNKLLPGQQHLLFFIFYCCSIKNSVESDVTVNSDGEYFKIHVFKIVF